MSRATGSTAHGDDGTRSGIPTGFPADYYQHLYDAELTTWWHRGMRSISKALLGDRLRRPEGCLLDAGCGTGGTLAWLADQGSFQRISGADISSAAIELATHRVPEAELRVAPLSDLPFESSAFDLIVTYDVLQHVAESEMEQSLAELRRLLRPDGAMLVRTNGARTARRERHDWRAYDRAALASTLEGAGFRCERVTYANMLPSLWAVARNRPVRAPTETSDGITRPGGPLQAAIGYRVLSAEARYLARSQRALPYGHTLLALVTPA